MTLISFTQLEAHRATEVGLFSPNNLGEAKIPKADSESRALEPQNREDCSAECQLVGSGRPKLQFLIFETE